MIADMINNKKFNPVVTELFIIGRKLNISIVFITQSYFKVPKDVRLNSTHFFIMNSLQNHKFTAEPYSFLVNDTTLSSDYPLRFRNNLLE